MIKILYEDNHVIAVVKPINMPVCPDGSHDQSLLDYIKKYLKQKYNKPGNVYLGLIHRLDRPVGGIMVFAKTSKAASRMAEQIRTNKITKKYYAVVCGNLKGKGIMKDKLLKDKTTNIVTINEQGKEAILEYQTIANTKEYSLIDIHLITGRPHQIRVQFSSRGYPLYGDQKYNPKAKKNQQIALFSYYLSFTHPTTKEKIELREPLPPRKPFDTFKKNTGTY